MRPNNTSLADQDISTSNLTNPRYTFVSAAFEHDFDPIVEHRFIITFLCASAAYAHPYECMCHIHTNSMCVCVAGANNQILLSLSDVYSVGIIKQRNPMLASNQFSSNILAAYNDIACGSEPDGGSRAEVKFA